MADNELNEKVEEEKSAFFIAGQNHARDTFRNMNELAKIYGSEKGPQAEFEFRSGVASVIPQFEALYPFDSKTNINSDIEKITNNRALLLANFVK